MTDGDARRLMDALPDCPLEGDVPLSGYTTIRTGGPAKLFMEAASAEDICGALKAASGLGIPLLVIGAGSNVLLSDEGFDGLVIHCGGMYAAAAVEGQEITAKAGAGLPALARLALRHGLSGLEFAAGIPGSAGGAALMNAGAYGGDMSQVVRSVLYADRSGRRGTFSGGEIAYAYRTSRLLREGLTVLSVTMRLEKSSEEQIASRMEEMLSRRRAAQPLQLPSAGSFFKRPAGHSAGELIDRCGLKGHRIGGAAVSGLHAGFFVNLGGATTGDFLSLMRHVQRVVLEQHGVLLEPEVRVIGRAG